MIQLITANRPVAEFPRKTFWVNDFQTAPIPRVLRLRPKKCMDSPSPPKISEVCGDCLKRLCGLDVGNASQSQIRGQLNELPLFLAFLSLYTWTNRLFTSSVDCCLSIAWLHSLHVMRLTACLASGHGQKEAGNDCGSDPTGACWEHWNDHESLRPKVMVRWCQWLLSHVVTVWRFPPHEMSFHSSLVADE